MKLEASRTVIPRVLMSTLLLAMCSTAARAVDPDPSADNQGEGTTSRSNTAGTLDSVEQYEAAIALNEGCTLWRLFGWYGYEMGKWINCLEGYVGPYIMAHGDVYGAVAVDYDGAGSTYGNGFALIECSNGSIHTIAQEWLKSVTSALVRHLVFPAESNRPVEDA